jgi:3-oxoadipate enol-lactonase
MPLYREETGKGPVLVLLHAGICDSRMWEPQWEAFSESYRTIRVDLRGYGRSPLDGVRRSFAGDVADVLAEMAIDRAMFVGCSIGGQIALELALARPGLVDRVILVGAGLPEHERSDFMKLADAREEAALDGGDIAQAVRIALDLWVAGPHRRIDDVAPEVRSAVAEMLRHAYELQLPLHKELHDDLLVPDVRRRLHEVEAEALVVVGQDDVEDMQVIADQLVSELPSVRRTVIGDAAHLVSMERPREFNPLALDFLAASSLR